MILSVSRRCDIPRFAFDWFLERLDEGAVELSNPFNPGQKKRISLLPAGAGGEGVDLIAFWTRDPASILEHAEELEGRGYPFYVMTTLNAYPALLEPNVPPREAVIKTMRNLALKISGPGGGSERVIWRYDPVFISNITDFEFHKENFSGLAAQLNGTVRRVIISVYDEYARAEKRLARLEQSNSLERIPHYENVCTGQKLISAPIRELLAELARIAGREGMEIQSCAEEDLSDCGIKPGACIDANFIENVFRLKAPGKDRGQKRPGCLCAQSADIGTYGSCPAGCVYCYASS